MRVRGEVHSQIAKKTRRKIGRQVSAEQGIRPPMGDEIEDKRGTGDRWQSERGGIEGTKVKKEAMRRKISTEESLPASTANVYDTVTRSDARNQWKKQDCSMAKILGYWCKGFLGDVNA